MMRARYATRLRSSIVLQSPIELLHTESKVLPESDQEAGIHRAEDGSLKPTKTSGLANSFKLKLQDPTHLKSFVDFGRRLPSRGVGATKLLLSAAAERRGRKATKAAMLAGPMLLNAREPRGIAKTRRLPTLNVRTNVVFIDENADVTFGVTARSSLKRATVRDARAQARWDTLGEACWGAGSAWEKRGEPRLTIGSDAHASCSVYVWYQWCVSESRNALSPGVP